MARHGRHPLVPQQHPINQDVTNADLTVALLTGNITCPHCHQPARAVSVGHNWAHLAQHFPEDPLGEPCILSLRVVGLAGRWG
jgi:cytochrome c551/c552